MIRDALLATELRTLRDTLTHAQADPHRPPSRATLLLLDRIVVLAEHVIVRQDALEHDLINLRTALNAIAEKLDRRPRPESPESGR